MAQSQVGVDPAVLERSLRQLCAITEKAYPAQIRDVALSQWRRQLQPDNPQWQFVSIKPFHVSKNGESAHVLAMYDTRLQHMGLVGYFACTNSKMGAAVLCKAAEWLKKNRDITNIYGPINGTLPNDYRLNMQDDYQFPGEPVNPLWHIEAFKEAGFATFNSYGSARLKHYNLHLKFAFPKPKGEYKHITIRPFCNDDFDHDFETYHHLRNLIFPFQSIYCAAISLQERQYNAPGKFDPNYTYFLQDGNRPVGFIMAYPYNNQLVLKTIGILPEYRGKRLAGLLLKRVHDQAHKDGLQSVIYAMVRSGNGVDKKRHPAAKVFRHYITMRKQC